MTPSTSAATQMVVLLGHPVAHSRSPALHSRAFALAGLDAVYVAADVPPDSLASAVSGLRALGALGANVTVPHKVAVLEHVDRLTQEAQLIGAANTLFWDDGVLVADNTDASGLETVLRDEVEIGAATHVQIFGAGGAARAAAVAVGRLGSRISVVARRPEAGDMIRSLAVEQGAEPGAGRADVVVNATPLGLQGERLPEPFMSLAADQTALELIYGIDTPFLTAAASNGLRTFDGMGMLVGQAEAAFSRWTGAAPPEGAYRAV